MFARINKKNLQYIGLAGTLVFTLSTLPGMEDASETTNASRSEAVGSSTSLECNGLGNRDYDFCVLNGTGELSHIKAEVNVRLIEDQVRDTKDPNIMVPSKEFEVEMRTLCKQMDGDCEEKTSVLRVPLKEHRQLISKTRDQFRSDAKVVADAKVAAAQKRQDEFECKGKKDGELVSCRITQMKRVDDAKAAAYFQTHVLPEIKSLLSKPNPAEQQKGMTLLKAYAEAGIGNDYINQSIETHRQFGFYNRQYVQDKMMLEGYARQNPFSPQVRQAYELASMHRRQAEAYFYNRGLEVPQSWEMGGYNLGGWMQNDLSSMRQTVADHYAMTMNQYQYGTNQMLANNLTNGWNQPAVWNNGQPVNPLQQNQMQQPIQYQNGYPVPPMAQQRMANVNPNINQPMPQSAVQQQQGGFRNINPRTNMRAPLR